MSLSRVTVSPAVGTGLSARIGDRVVDVLAESVYVKTNTANTDWIANSAAFTGGAGGGVAISAGTQLATSGTVVFSNSNNVSWTMNGSTQVVASVSFPAQTTQPGIQSISAGTTRITTGEVVYGDANGISFGANGQTVTASYTVPSVPVIATTVGPVASANSVGTAGRWAPEDHAHAGVNSVSVVGNTAGATTAGAGSLVLAGGPNITLSATTAAGGMTVSVSAAAAGGGGGATISSWEPWQGKINTLVALSCNTNTSGPASFFPFQVPEAVAAGWLGVIKSMTFTTGSTSSFRQSNTASWAIYTRGTGASSTLLSQMTNVTGSVTFGVTYNNSTISISQASSTNSTGYGFVQTTSAGLNITSGYTGLKLFHLYLGTTLTPGHYWWGIFERNSSSSFNSGIRVSYVGAIMSVTNIAPMGSFSTAFTTGTNLVGGLGRWRVGMASFTSAGQTNLPASVALSAMTCNVSIQPYMNLWSTA